MVFLVNLLVAVSVMGTTMGLENGGQNSIRGEGQNTLQSGPVFTHLESTLSDDSEVCHYDKFEAERDEIFYFCLKTAENISSDSFVNYTAGSEGNWIMTCAKSSIEAVNITAIGVYTGLPRLSFGVTINVQSNKSVKITLNPGFSSTTKYTGFNSTTKYRLHWSANGQVVTVSVNADERTNFRSCQTYEFLIKIQPATFLKCINVKEKPIFDDEGAHFIVEGTNTC